MKNLLLALFVLLAVTLETQKAEAVALNPGLYYTVAELGNSSELANGFIGAESFDSANPNVNGIFSGDGSVKVLEEGLFEINLLSVMDSDPFINYALGVINLSNSNLLFNFSFVTPVVDGPYGVSQASTSASLTDALTDQDDEASLLSFNQDSYVDAGTDIGVDLTPPDCIQSGGGNGASYPCPAYNTFGSFGPIFPTSLHLDLSFILSHHDLASVNGLVSITPVPEPASMALLAGAAAFLPWRRRRQLSR